MRWLFVLLLAGSAWAQPFPGIGGMLYVGNHTYLVGHDAKAAQPPKPRLGVITVEDGVHYRELQVDWSATGESSDIESLCALPGGDPGGDPVASRGDRFLAIESRQFKGKYGRILVIEHTPERTRSVQAIYLPVLQAQVEGSVCLTLPDGRLLLIVGGRGGDPAYAPGRLHWGILDLARGTFELTPEGREGLDLPAPMISSEVRTRGISDLYLDIAGYLWVSCADEFSDMGPMRSLIYRAGRVRPRLDNPLDLAAPQELLWVIDGYKVEALAAPCLEHSTLSFGTDDEHLGGTWRPLPPAAPYRIR